MARRRIRITQDDGFLSTNIVDIESGVGLTGQIVGFTVESKAGEITIAKLEIKNPVIDITVEADEETSAAISRIIEGQ